MNIQMLLVLLALALFSTMLLNTYNIVLDQSGLVYDNILYLQGQKIADRYFQRIESELLGDPPIFSFTAINSLYSNMSETVTVNNVIFNVQINSTYCDSLGNTPYADTLFQKVDIQMNCLSTSLDTLYIGTLLLHLVKFFSLEDFDYVKFIRCSRCNSCGEHGSSDDIYFTFQHAGYKLQYSAPDWFNQDV